MDIDDQWHVVQDGRRVRSARYGVGKRYRARWRDADHRQRAKFFDRKIDAERHLAQVKADLIRGQYVDPAAGKITLGAYARDWISSRTTGVSTIDRQTHEIDAHIVPALGGRPLAGLRPSVIQSWVAGLDLAPGSVGTSFATLNAIMNAAVEDGLIPRNPCQSSAVKLPRAERRPVRPWSAERVAA